MNIKDHFIKLTYKIESNFFTTPCHRAGSVLRNGAK